MRMHGFPIQLFRQLPPDSVKGGYGKERNRSPGGDVGLQKSIMPRAFGQLLRYGQEHALPVPGRLALRMQLHGGTSAIFRQCLNTQGALVDLYPGVHFDFPDGFAGLELSLKGGTDVPVQGHPFPELFRNPATDREAFTDIGPEAGDGAAAAHEGETIAVGKPDGRVVGNQREPFPADASHLAHILAHGFGRIQGGPLAAHAIQKELRVATVEGFVHVGDKTLPNLAPRRPAVLLRVTVYQGIQGLGIGFYHVSHIGFTLEPALDLEGGNARGSQFFQAAQQVIVLQGKDRLVAKQHLAGSIFQVIQAAAGLGAGTAVGTAAGQVFREIALPAVTHAQGTVHKELYFCIYRTGNGLDLLQRKLPLQHQTAKTQTLQPTGFLRRADGALGRGMHHQRRTHGQHGRILDNESIHSRRLELMHHGPGLGNFFWFKQGIYRGIDAYAESMGVLAQGGDILDGISGRLPCPEGGTGNVYGIGAAIDGGPANLCISGRGQEFQPAHLRKAEG